MYVPSLRAQDNVPLADLVTATHLYSPRWQVGDLRARR